MNKMVCGKKIHTQKLKTAEKKTTSDDEFSGKLWFI